MPIYRHKNACVRSRAAQCHRLLGSPEHVKYKLPLVVDTREQTPWRFDDEHVTTIRSTVPVFDYAVQDDTQSWAVERKSVNDFIGSVSTSDGWRRELAKIEKARVVFDGKPIVYIVEGTVEDILSYDYDRRHHKITSQFIFLRVSEMIYKHGAHVIFAGAHAADFATLLLKRRYEDITGLECNLRRAGAENGVEANDETGSNPIYSEEGFLAEEADRPMV